MSTDALDVRSATRSYFTDAFASTPGLKALLLDEASKRAVAMVMTQSELLDAGVYYTGTLDKPPDTTALSHMNAIVFIRPSDPQSVRHLLDEISAPHFSEYSIYFTNSCPKRGVLDALAKGDSMGVVRRVEEVFCDFYCVDKETVSFELSGILRLSCRPRPRWSRPEESSFKEIARGITSFCLALKRAPSVRFSSSSDVCRHLASELRSRFSDTEAQLFDFAKVDPAPVLLVLDRRQDPVTPLLTQWTYQAMVHELLGLSHNVVDLGGGEKVVLSSQSDAFFEKFRVANYGDLAEGVKTLLETYQSKLHTNKKINSIADMQQFLEDYPQFAKLSNDASKHVMLVGALSKLVDSHSLLELSALEQELACGSHDHNGHYTRVLSCVEDHKVADVDSLRLVLLYALRYETHSQNRTSTLKKKLTSKGVSNVDLVDKIISYGGSTKRGNDLFGDSGTYLSRSLRIVKRTVKGVNNVFTQHKPWVATLLETFNHSIVGDFPYAAGCEAVGEPKEVFVYMHGGCTFEESAKVAQLNESQPNRRYVLLGSRVLNSKSFLDELSDAPA